MTPTPDGSLIDRRELRTLHRGTQPMGNQPALDGIRAVSVAIVILYHAGLGFIHGGFFGVEVFFVVSGYLITTLLIDERTARGAVSLRGFWIRRARRLLPALFVMLVAVSLWAAFTAPEHVPQLRHDLLPAVFYVSNWAQIFGSVPYFSPAVPLLRHLWSLAVEEQWYLLWPLLFVGLHRWLRHNRRTMAWVLGVAAVAAMCWSAWLTRSGEIMMSVVGRDVDRYNFLYLNTIGRASGLLAGAAAAMVWRPWGRAPLVRGSNPDTARAVARDVVGLLAMAGIVAVEQSWPRRRCIESGCRSSRCVRWWRCAWPSILGHNSCVGCSVGAGWWHWGNAATACICGTGRCSCSLVFAVIRRGWCRRSWSLVGWPN